jgi:ribosome biogenesis GTPase A
VLRDRERERERDRQTDRQTDREREGERRQPVKYNLCSFIFSGPARLYTTKITNMKTEEMTNMPRVRIAVLGKINVGKSGKYLPSCCERLGKWAAVYTV